MADIKFDGEIIDNFELSDEIIEPDFTVEEISDEGGAAVASATESQETPKYEPQWTEEELNEQPTIDVEIDDMEWTVETEGEQASFHDDQAYGQNDYVDSHDYNGYRDYEDNYRQQYDYRYRRINKHLFTWLFAFFLGMYGADRFARGQIGMGILKLLTFGGFGFWYLADFIIALVRSYGTYADSEDLLFDVSGYYVL